MKIYESFPTFENEEFLLRAVTLHDCTDLLEVYGDKNALPFFNSDNCDGDNFYYPTKERMTDALLFWQSAYENKWFARWTIVSKSVSKAIGTIELCLRVSEDAFHNAAILRLDLGSAYEKEDWIQKIGSLIVPPTFPLFECSTVITKAPIYAVERIAALQKLGFHQSENCLIGKNGHLYDGYWVLERTV